MQQQTETATCESVLRNEPVGTGEYVIRQGDCLESIASRSGHFWETIWEHPANATLRRVRRHHNLLLPGDCLHIPAIDPGQVSRPTDQRHRFVRRGATCKLRVRVELGGRPRANQPFLVTVCGKCSSGTTGAHGEVEVAIPPSATSAKLEVGTGIFKQVYQLELGSMDPLSTRDGIHKRLQNLGYCRDGNRTPEQLAAAIAQFQKNHGIDATGQIDQATNLKLRQQHGS